MIDFIADVHGYADKLEWLLCKMGYEKKGGTYKHQERTVLFVGDYIDRGPDNPGVVSIVRKMVDAGSAQALMGNHEYNAIMFNMLGDNSYLRPHTIKNFKQHSDTLLQFLGKQEKYDEMITWFKTLPMYIEGNGFRAVHASWDNNSIHILKSQTINGVLTEEQFVESANAEAAIHQAVEITSKGLEVELPEGNSFKDKDGTERFNIRIKWWENPQGKNYEAMSWALLVEGKASFIEAQCLLFGLFSCQRWILDCLSMGWGKSSKFRKINLGINGANYNFRYTRKAFSA